MKPTSFFAFLAAGAVVLLSIAAGGLFWLTASSPLAVLRPTQTATPAAAMFVPSSAPAFASLLVNPEELEAFRQVVAAPQLRRRSRAYFAQIKQSFLATTDLNYERDIQPWLGDEISIACTTADIDRDPDNGAQPGYLLAIATKDKQRSREFLDLFWGSKAIAGSEVTFESYKGTTLIYNKTAGSPFGSVATTAVTSPVAGEQFVLFANHPKVLRDAINNVQVPNLNLQNSSAYQSAVQQLTQPKIALGFVNLPQLAAWIGTESASASATAKDQLAIALGLNRDGLLAQTALIADWNATHSLAPSLSEPVQALKYLPAASVLAAAGTDLQQLWSEVAEGASHDPIAQLLDRLLAGIGDRWGLDLPRDVFSWVRGEYALALLPRDAEAAAGGPEFDWIFVAQQSPDASQGIEHLDAIAQQQGLSSGPLKLGDREIFAWTKLSAAPTAAVEKADSPIALEARVFGVRASADNYEIFTSSIQAMEAAIAAHRAGSLTAAPDFRQAISVLPSPNYGYVYLDWKAAEEILERRFPLLKLLEASSQSIVDRLRAIAITSTGSEAGVRRADLFLRLGL